VTVVQEVNVVAVFNGGVTAIGTVDVAVVVVSMAHILYPRF